MRPFPDIEFTMPGEEVARTSYGVVTQDDWGRYALLKGVGPDDASAPGLDQTYSAFVNVERELEAFGMDFPDVVRTWLYADRILDWYADQG